MSVIARVSYNFLKAEDIFRPLRDRYATVTFVNLEYEPGFRPGGSVYGSEEVLRSLGFKLWIFENTSSHCHLAQTCPSWTGREDIFRSSGDPGWEDNS
jgi:hypothetical protein